jgi:hypothetical protein
MALQINVPLWDKATYQTGQRLELSATNVVRQQAALGL